MGRVAPAAERTGRDTNQMRVELSEVPLKLRRPREAQRSYPANGNDFDVIGPNGERVGRIFKPGGGSRDWMWCLSAVVRPPLRNHGYADTREGACGAFRETWQATLAQGER